MRAELVVQPRPRRFRPLAHRQAIQFALVAGGLLLLSGLVDMVLAYREARDQTQALQKAQASAASREISQYLRGLEAALLDTAKLPWGAPGLDLARQREDFLRLMVLYPTVAELRSQDAQGHELLFISRTEPDRLSHQPLAPRPAGTQATAATTVSYDTPYFQNGSEPYVRLSVGEAGGGTHTTSDTASDTANSSASSGITTTATVHLRLVADVLTQLGLDKGGQAYLVDEHNRLIAHPTQIEMLRQRDLSALPLVQAARTAQAARTELPLTTASTDLGGRAVISTAVALPGTGWLLFLEQPRSVVLAQALWVLTRTALLMALGAVLAALASTWQARRLARPIVALREASARIAKGDFGTPIALHTADELEELAGDLNNMARRLNTFYQQLESQVQVRTVELSQARDSAERASQAKTRFLASASHDLRQPMHTIGLLVGVLEERLVNPELHNIAHKLNQSVEAMERLFGSLLDISKLDAGVVVPQRRSFAVQELLDHIAQRFELSAVERHLRLRVVPCRAWVDSDPGLLERCVGNLVSNALRYTRTGSVLVGCRRRAGGRLAIQVLDTGIGIAAEHQAAVFEEFVRLPSAEGAQAKGLGLGLAIVRRTAELLGHPLSLRSQAGRGSVFELSLPAALAPAATSGEQALPAEATGTRGHSALAGLFVLVVDDNADNRQALEGLCQRWGCLVATAASAPEALALLDDHLRSPDLVLTDWHLGPGQDDGLALMKALREATEEATPGVLITAETSPEVQHQARDMGLEVLHKPASSERVLQAILALLQRVQAGEQPNAQPNTRPDVKAAVQPASFSG